MKKRLPIVIIFMFAALLLTGCQKNLPKKNPAEMPEITVTSGDNTIAWVSGLNKWNGSVYDREDNFKVYFDKYTSDELTALEEEDIITIDFAGAAPDSFSLTDCVLTDNGKLMFDGKVTQTVEEAKLKDDKISFEFGVNFAELLSSTMSEYYIRGFKLTCTWGENECEYAFAIKHNTRWNVILNTDVNAYRTVFEALMNNDQALNSDIKYIALDCEKAKTEHKDELEAEMEEYCAQNGYKLLLDNFDGLCEKGYIDKENLYFPDGVVIAFDDIELTEEKLITKATKWRSGRGAIGATYTVLVKDGEWVLEKTENEWIS